MNVENNNFPFLEIKSKTTKNVFLKSVLCNYKSWCSRIDCEEMSCTCSILTIFLGTKVSRHKHICSLMVSTSLVKGVPPNFTAESILVPMMEDVVAKVKKEFDRLCSCLKMWLDFRPLEDYIVEYFELVKHSNFMIQSTIVSWKKKKKTLQIICVISPVDKCSSQVAFMCPYFFQRCVLNSQVMGKHIVYFVDVGMESVFHEMRQSFLYSGVVTIVKRRFGLWTFILKLFGFECQDQSIGFEFVKKKFRFIGDYSGHMFAKVYSLISGVLNFMFDVLDLDGISIMTSFRGCKGLCAFRKFLS